MRTPAAWLPLLLLPLTALGGPDRVNARDYALPKPGMEGEPPLNEALRQRRSLREFAARPLALGALSQLLWAAQGITAAGGRRTAPSAGALYPLELHVVAGRVDGLPAGTYRYEPDGHTLTATGKGELLAQLSLLAYGQQWIAKAPAAVVITGVYRRTTGKYGQRGIRYVHIEVGHAGQNLLLQAEALGLGATVVGAFNDRGLARLLGLAEGERPLAVLPVGHPASRGE